MHVNKEKSKEHSMARKIIRATLLGLVGTLIVASLVAAQQPSMSGHMSMEAMMRECQTHCQETTASIDHMMTTMSQAGTELAFVFEDRQSPGDWRMCNGRTMLVVLKSLSFPVQGRVNGGSCSRSGATTGTKKSARTRFSGRDNIGRLSFA